MGMKTLYQEVMDLNQMEDSDPKEAAAKAFFENYPNSAKSFY